MKKRPFFHSAAIHALGNRLIINPYARTRDGVRTGMPILATASLDDARDIGIKTLAMLDQCEDDVPDDYTGGPSPAVAVILREAKERSWRVFHKKARMVGVFREIGGATIEITPTRRQGSASYDLDDKAQISGTDPEELGRVIQLAISLAE